MESLLKEIESKEKEVAESRKNRRKYFKRGETNTNTNADKDKNTNTNNEVTRKREIKTETSTIPESSVNQKNNFLKMNLTREEVVAELRACDAPIRLFGETDMDSFRRLKMAQLNKSGKKGMRNEFQEALEKVEQNLIKNMNEDENNNAKEFELYTVQKSLAELNEMSKATDTGDFALDSDFIIYFCQNILNLWAKDISSRPLNVRKTTKCMLESARYDQTKTYISPLLEKLKQRTLTDHIRDCLVRVVQQCLERDYVRANDMYLQLAVGNAPWPIGVTQVCIHARTGRERIANNQIAHVLNDETQRKYIQAVKRLMTACQNYFPAEPSRSVC